jgi:hypothetical protein
LKPSSAGPAGRPALDHPVLEWFDRPPPMRSLPTGSRRLWRPLIGSRLRSPLTGGQLNGWLPRCALRPNWLAPMSARRPLAGRP